MGMLSLTFRGPFLFVVPPANGANPSPTVDIWAPICDEHLGSVFYGDGSYPIYGNGQNGRVMKYAVMGVTPNGGAISFQWNPLLSATPIFVSPDTEAPPVPTNLNLKFAYFGITVPRPKIFYAMNSVKDTEIVKNGTVANIFPVVLTAFRLYYDWNLTSPVSLQTPPSVSAFPFIITPPAGPTLPGSPAGFLPLADAADIEFEYEGSGTADPDHQDASACFGGLAQLAGLPWFLNFDNSGGMGGGQFRRGSDCTAVPLVLGLNN